MQRMKLAIFMPQGDERSVGPRYWIVIGSGYRLTTGRPSV